MAWAHQRVDLKPLLPPSLSRTLASEVALHLACTNMVEEEEEDSLALTTMEHTSLVQWSPTYK
jgi:hypothetical protein